MIPTCQFLVWFKNDLFALTFHSLSPLTTLASIVNVNSNLFEDCPLIIHSHQSVSGIHNFTSFYPLMDKTQMLLSGPVSLTVFPYQIEKLKAQRVSIPSKIGNLAPSAKELIMKLLTINTNVSSGTFIFRETIENLLAEHPGLQGHVANAMKVFQSNSVGVTKAYFRLLLGGSISARGSKTGRVERGGASKRVTPVRASAVKAKSSETKEVAKLTAEDSPHSGKKIAKVFDGYVCSGEVIGGTPFYNGRFLRVSYSDGTKEDIRTDELDDMIEVR